MRSTTSQFREKPIYHTFVQPKLAIVWSPHLANDKITMKKYKDVLLSQRYDVSVTGKLNG